MYIFIGTSPLLFSIQMWLHYFQMGHGVKRAKILFNGNSLGLELVIVVLLIADTIQSSNELFKGPGTFIPFKYMVTKVKDMVYVFATTASNRSLWITTKQTHSLSMTRHVTSPTAVTLAVRTSSLQPTVKQKKEVKIDQIKKKYRYVSLVSTQLQYIFYLC